MRKLLVIWLLAWVVTGAAQPPKKALKAYEQARAAFAERDYSKAPGHVHKALTAAPAFAEAWLLQGEIGMETRDFDQIRLIKEELTKAGFRIMTDRIQEMQ